MSLNMGVKTAAKAILPGRMRDWLRGRKRTLLLSPPFASMRFASLRRLTPVSPFMGFDRGRCIDRYYIESFLAKNANDFRGRVLEIGDNAYTLQFGGHQFIHSDVLHPVTGNPKATILADLSHGDDIPSDSFDCIVLTQTLQFIYDIQAAIRTIHRVLKPGGVVLATANGISRICRYDMDLWGEYWRLTNLSTRRLFEEAFGAGDVDVETHGNVAAAVAFLHGLAADELRREELDYHDPDFEILITVRAIKRSSEAH